MKDYMVWQCPEPALLPCGMLVGVWGLGGTGGRVGGWGPVKWGWGRGRVGAFVGGGRKVG